MRVRASEVQVGDVLAGNERVISVTAGATWVHVRARVGNGPVLRHRYRPDTIVPTPEHPNPGQHEQGHPWAMRSAIPKRRPGKMPN